MKRAIIIDIERCVGCGACVVACMDQNDIYPENGQVGFRNIYQIENGRYPDATVQFISVSCNHCEDSPCIVACPTGAIKKDDKSGAVVVNHDLCIGCHSCALACPFGVPRYDVENKMKKCDMCVERVEAGLQPACVRVCPFGALSYEPVNEMQGKKQLRYYTTLMKGL